MGNPANTIIKTTHSDSEPQFCVPLVGERMSRNMSSQTVQTELFAVAQGCPECGGTLDSSGRETHCENCGLVTEQDQIDHGPEWRTYDRDYSVSVQIDQTYVEQLRLYWYCEASLSSCRCADTDSLARSIRSSGRYSNWHCCPCILPVTGQLDTYSGGVDVCHNSRGLLHT